MNLKQKIKTFFHDPIDKIFDIHQHKRRAVEYAKIVTDEDLFNQDVETSDHIAAAADRLNLPENIGNQDKFIKFTQDAELTHPLGCSKISIGALVTNWENLESAIKNCLNEIKQNSKSEKELLLNLWRNIPSKLMGYEEEKFKLGNFWDLLPADSRIPDHSILDHNWLAVAINGSLNEIAFLKFSIGPVQNFITKAKRTEDYWAGSYILSYLSSKAIEVIIEKAGPEHIIYPYIKRQPLIDKILKENYEIHIEDTSKRGSLKIPSLPNIILAILPYNEAQNIAQEMVKKIKESFNKISNTIQEKFKEFFDDDSKNLWNTQISDFIETYYVIYKWPKSINDLKKQYEEITKTQPETIQGEYIDNIGNYWKYLYKITDIAFNSRKNLRNFKQIEDRSSFVKCSLCGEREVLHKKEIKTNRDLIDFWSKIGNNEVSKFKIDPAGRDRLCAVCLTKRMFGEYFYKEKIEGTSINYPSTSTIAALPFKIKLISNSESLNYIKNYNYLLKQIGISNKTSRFDWHSVPYIYNKMQAIKNNQDAFETFDEFLSIDGQWIYKESFTKKNLEEIGIEFKSDTVNQILSIIQSLEKLVKESPSKYFAVINMDGDDMGKWLSGTHPDWPKWKDVLHSSIEDLIDESIANQKRNLSPSVTAFISKCLNYFALELVPKIVEEDYPGKIVYCGGDDLLAFSPIDFALDIAEKLRFAFSGNIAEEGKIDLNKQTGYIILSQNNKRKIIPTLGKATLSAGIVIAHKDHNLSDILQHANLAKEKAKTEQIYGGLGKDAFVIKIIKRSGDITEFGSKWIISKDNSKHSAVEKIKFILEKVSKNNKKEGLSMSFFQSMLNDIEKIQSVTFINSLLKLNIKRHIIFKRQENENNFEDRKKQNIESLLQTFKMFSSSEYFVELLSMLRFLSSGGER